MSWQVFSLSLSAALIFCVGAAMIQFGMGRGFSASTVNLLCAAGMGLLMQVFWLFPIDGDWQGNFWRPIIAGLLFAIGQILGIFAIQKSGIAVATPIFGAKTLCVVVFLWAFGAPPPDHRWWVAAALCSLGIALVSFERSKGIARLSGVLAGILSAVVFGMTDAVFQVWVSTTGLGFFAPVMFLSLAFFSFVFTGRSLFQKRTTPAIPAPTMWILLGGIFLWSLQGSMLASAIGLFQDAASANIVYGSRAVFAVIAGFLLLKFLRPHDLPDATILWRNPAFWRKLIGAVLIFLSILLILS